MYCYDRGKLKEIYTWSMIIVLIILRNSRKPIEGLKTDWPWVSNNDTVDENENGIRYAHYIVRRFWVTERQVQIHVFS